MQTPSAKTVAFVLPAHGRVCDVLKSISTAHPNRPECHKRPVNALDFSRSTRGPPGPSRTLLNVLDVVVKTEESCSIYANTVE